MTYEDILVSVEEGVATLTINRPANANTLRFQTARELLEALRHVRETPAIDVAVLTGAGEKFFCIGGEHEPVSSLRLHRSVMPIIDLYELIDSVPKPVIAAVNGFAVGGRQRAAGGLRPHGGGGARLFRQVGPMVGSFDAGYGTWYLEETIGRKRAKEMWYFNRKYTAEKALSRWVWSTRSPPTLSHAPHRSPRPCAIVVPSP